MAERGITNDVKTDENVTFEDLAISELTLNSLKKAGFIKSSPIQLQALPLALLGLDLLIQAKSGTGKTLVFSITALEFVQTIDDDEDLTVIKTKVIILAPTREIAQQIVQVIKTVKQPECIVHTFIGGTALKDDQNHLKKCHIVVGTPGRIEELLRLKYLRPDTIRLLVLDEADALLCKEFQDQINSIFSYMPSNKQVLLASATYPEHMIRFSERYMRDMTCIRLVDSESPSLIGIQQFYIIIPYHPIDSYLFEQKVLLLLRILPQLKFRQCLIFSNLRMRSSAICERLKSLGYETTYTSSSLTQNRRTKAMRDMYKHKCQILVTTDLTSRGIDLDFVDFVISMDLPNDSETYLHRIGRAGRFGAYGCSLTIVSDGDEQKQLEKIQNEFKLNLIGTDENQQFQLLINALEQVNMNIKTYLNLILTTFSSISLCNEEKIDRYCRKCLNYSRERSHHCNLCQLCIPIQDHHCFFVGTCIGKHNQRYFLLMLFHLLCAHFIGYIFVFNYLWNEIDGFHILNIFKILFFNIGYLIGFIKTKWQAFICFHHYLVYFDIIFISKLFYQIMKRSLNGQTYYEEKKMIFKNKQTFSQIFGSNKWILIFPLIRP
ncbi:unnamed protein product [Rotaria sordida]|uniref:Palmitoyltransferase n=1 Tax=Rotaria sordida TaxID=392033 RepID=A0A818WS59_9BILA|nr:unnamed protein product [Rotaria sordida]